jgi:RNA polymerase sigma-70 factor (ECF subfamily)
MMPTEVASTVSNLGAEAEASIDRRFENMVRRYRHFVYDLCYQITHNPADAEDLTQEVFVKAYVALREAEPRPPLSAWLYQIAYRRSTSFLASRRRRPERAVAPRFMESRYSARERHDPILIDRSLDPALGQLKRDDRVILTLKYELGLDMKELSSVLGITVGAAKMRLLRARRDVEALHHRAVRRQTDAGGYEA